MGRRRAGLRRCGEPPAGRVAPRCGHRAAGVCRWRGLPEQHGRRPRRRPGRTCPASGGPCGPGGQPRPGTRRAHAGTGPGRRRTRRCLHTDQHEPTEPAQPGQQRRVAGREQGVAEHPPGGVDRCGGVAVLMGVDAAGARESSQPRSTHPVKDFRSGRRRVRPGAGRILVHPHCQARRVAPNRSAAAATAASRDRVASSTVSVRSGARNRSLYASDRLPAPTWSPV